LAFVLRIYHDAGSSECPKTNRSVFPVLQASHNFLTNKLFGAQLFLGSSFTSSWIRNFAPCVKSEVHYPVYKRL